MTEELDEWYDPESKSYLVNGTGVPSAEVGKALFEQHPHLRESIGNITSAFTASYSAAANRQMGIFQRDRYVTPESVAKQMQLAAHAARYDDVVSGVLESTESMTFTRATFEHPDPDMKDVWNQIAADINLDNVLRQAWRELFTVSQCYMVVWPRRKTFTVRGKGEQRRRRKTYDLIAPAAVTFLDPLRVVPVGNFVFGREDLAYLADRTEGARYAKELADENSSDLVVKQLFTGEYKPSREEKEHLQALGFTTDYMFILNPDLVSRHTLTRATYERFADVRMASIFELLDLKNLLRAMDRSTLLGSINYIILIKIGTDERPGKQPEIAAMTARVQQGARLPVLVGDHRLSVEIVSPKADSTLRPERYNTIDSRITSRLYNILTSGGYESGKSGDDSLKLSRVMGRALESRRHMLRRYLEENLIMPFVERNDDIGVPPKLRFAPKRISLAFDPNMISMLKDLRDRGDLSRETILGELDFSQDDEAAKREYEAEHYDEIFQTSVPHSAPTSQPFNPSTDPRTAGRTRGGSRNGGGRPEGSPDSQDRQPRGSDE